MYPVFYQIVQGYNGMAGPPNKQYGPVSFMRLEECEAAISTRPNPENYHCVRYESAKAIDWTPPEAVPQAAPTPEKPEPKPTTKERDATAAPKKLAQRPRHDQEAMLEGNPLRVFFNW